MKEIDIIMEEQEQEEERYEYFGIPMVCTTAFREVFGEDSHEIMIAAREMIKEKYPEKNWDYLQVFSCQGISFWCISDAVQGEQGEEDHITFLLPSDY